MFRLPKEVVDLLLSRIDYEYFDMFLPFAYIGARICYSGDHPLLLFKENRLNSEEVIDFLSVLQKKGHYSVFAHVPVLVDTLGLSDDIILLIFKNTFKTFQIDKNYLLLNLRHLAESMDPESFKMLLKARWPECCWKNWNKFFVIAKFKIDEKEKEVEYKDILSDLLQSSIFSILTRKRLDDDVFVNHEIFYIKKFTPSHQRDPVKWSYVIAHNFSRIFSHQFVRHTILNFNQRSNRYTEIEKFVVPPSFTPQDVSLYKKVIDVAKELYNDVKNRVKKEDARFILPQGSATTILASGPQTAWLDFVKKRKESQAQWEIRMLASFLDCVITGR